MSLIWPDPYSNSSTPQSAPPSTSTTVQNQSAPGQCRGQLAPSPHRMPGNGRGDCGRRLNGNAMPKLPRQHEHRRFDQPSGLVHGAKLSELPQRNGHAQQRLDSIHLHFRHEWCVAPARGHDLRYYDKHTGDGSFALSLFLWSRRTSMFRLPRLDARGISQHTRE